MGQVDLLSYGAPPTPARAWSSTIILHSCKSVYVILVNLVAQQGRHYWREICCFEDKKRSARFFTILNIFKKNDKGKIGDLYT